MCVEKLLQNSVSAHPCCSSFHSCVYTAIVANIASLRLGVLLILHYSPVVMQCQEEKRNQKKTVGAWCPMEHVKDCLIKDLW